MMKAVLCDIEGTTTSIAFAHKVLFPLSLQRIESFVQENAELLKEEIEAVQRASGTTSLQDVIATLKRWIEEDRKEAALKSIQGKIWRDAFESGQIKGHVYPDVPLQFQKWYEFGVQIAIFSSGSVEAQRLIFRHSEAGDLSRFIAHYFDTKTGAKKECASYTRIAEALRLPADSIVFLSDVTAELDAASDAGMRTVLLLRDGAAAPQGNRHPTAENFHQAGVQD